MLHSKSLIDFLHPPSLFALTNRFKHLHRDLFETGSIRPIIPCHCIMISTSWNREKEQVISIAETLRIPSPSPCRSAQRWGFLFIGHNSPSGDFTIETKRTIIRLPDHFPFIRVELFPPMFARCLISVEMSFVLSFFSICSISIP